MPDNTSPDADAPPADGGASGVYDVGTVAADHRAGTDAGDASDAGVVLRLDDVTRAYGPETAVDGLSLSVSDGELFTLLGPSGCGKTTTLRLLAGLERPTSGTVVIDGRRVDGGDTFVPPDERNVGIVFQDFALFPHLTVAENVAFGLTDVDREEREARVADLLDLVDLVGFEDRDPSALSGGQRQRVALARALAPRPDVLLLDEPFSNLDVRLRVEMREEIRRILKEAGVTAVSVTHDQEEALSISDRVGVMCDGRLEQVGDPETVFEQPESRFVASFLGRASFVPGRVTETGVETPVWTLDRSAVAGLSDEYVGATVDVLVRPDDLHAVPADGDAGDGRVVSRQYNGPSFVYRVELDGGTVVRCLHNHADHFELGQRVSLELVANHQLAWYPDSDAV